MFQIPFHTNRYFILRHGHSQANEKGLIVSHPDNGIGQWGLSEKGEAQVRESITQAKEAGLFNPHIKPVVVYSPFLRALETAKIVTSILKGERYSDSNLKERFFGEFEMTQDTNYAKGWQEDAKNPATPHHQIESIDSVAKRMVEVVKRTGRRYSEKDVILVTHGDPGQILQCIFDGIPPEKHRSLDPLKTAEIRPIPSR
ncbi:MAG: histidine phosphatase family protein [Desulfobacterales bacterium]|nr:histidine phosphatase family protein [Desulfobacterales bacterium]